MAKLSNTHYENHFDPAHYFTTWYTKNQLDIDVSFPLMYQLYSSDKFKGGSLLDLCCGPVVHWLAAPSLKYTDITVADLLDKNLAEIKKWLQKAPDAIDWTGAFKLAADAEGVSDPAIIEDRVRAAVKDLFLCDVHKENPLLNVTKQFDAVQCSYGLESATQDRATLECAIKNISNLVKPGGSLVILSTLESTYYLVGPHNFSAMAITKEILIDILRGAGFENVEFSEVFGKKDTPVPICDFKGSFLCSAFKKR